MNRYWADHPPLAWMVAAYLGIKPKARSAAPTEAETDLMSALPTQPRPQVITPEQYFAEKNGAANGE